MRERVYVRLSFRRVAPVQASLNSRGEEACFIFSETSTDMKLVKECLN